LTKKKEKKKEKKTSGGLMGFGVGDFGLSAGRREVGGAGRVGGEHKGIIAEERMFWQEGKCEERMKNG
jgi:hypothetical protein